MADTKETICSRALVLIGADPITSFTSGSAEANVAAAQYESVVANELALHPWSFAKQHEILPRLAAAPLDRWTAAYQIPTQAQARQIHTVTVRGQPIDYDRFEDAIFCNAAESDVVVLEYAIRPDESRWPAFFTKLVELRMAAIFGFALAAQESLKGVFSAEAEGQAKRARHADSRAVTARRMPVNRFLALR